MAIPFIRPAHSEPHNLVDDNFKEVVLSIGDKEILSSLLLLSRSVKEDCISIDELHPEGTESDVLEYLFASTLYYLNAFESLPAKRMSLAMAAKCINKLNELYTGETIVGSETTH